MDYFNERFYHHLKEHQSSFDDAVELVLQEAEEANLDEEQITEVIDKLVKANVKLFADHYVDYESLYQSENPYAVLETYCQTNDISEDLANAMAITINKDSSSDDDSENDVIDAADMVFTDWRDMTTATHQAKVRAFLKALSAYGRSARELKPFLRQKNYKIGDLPNPWNIKVASQVSQYDNPRQTLQRNNLGESSAIFPEKDFSDPRHHDLHVVASKHGYSFSHSSANGFHVWSKGSHIIAAPFNDTKWHTKVDPTSAHSTFGVGSRSLDSHLANKARRYAKQNYETEVYNIPMLEQLMDPEGHEKIKQYARWLQNNENALGGDYDIGSQQKQDLFEAKRLQDKHDAVFNKDGKPIGEWNLGDFRKESGMQDKLLNNKGNEKQ